MLHFDPTLNAKRWEDTLTGQLMRHVQDRTELSEDSAFVRTFTMWAGVGYSVDFILDTRVSMLTITTFEADVIMQGEMKPYDESAIANSLSLYHGLVRYKTLQGAVHDASEHVSHPGSEPSRRAAFLKAHP